MRTLVSSAVWGLVPIPSMSAPGPLSQRDRWPAHRDNLDASARWLSHPQRIERMATKHEITAILSQLVQIGDATRKVR